MTTASTATGTIYGLVDPKTREVKYIGQTTKPIEARLAGHMAAPAPLVRAWIEVLAVEGQLPQIIPIRENVPIEQLDKMEKDEIAAHAERGDLLNTAGNAAGNAKRRQASREAAKRRKALEEATDRAWRQASWRKVADQIREATGGPMSPADIPIRDITTWVWDTYLAYREADEYLKAHPRVHLLLPPGVRLPEGAAPPSDSEADAASQRRSSARGSLECYLRAYCRAFSSVDDGDRWGSDAGVFGRGENAYEHPFRDPTHMARYLSLIPWAARALDPWVAIAEEAGMDRKSSEFTNWVSDDREVREAIELYQQGAPGLFGVFRQSWERSIPTYMLALAAAHIPGCVTPELLTSELEEKLTELARDRQATQEMCDLLQSLKPKALDAVYGRDELAEADEALGLPPGISAEVVRRIFGDNLRDPADRAAKLLQRNAGRFDVTPAPAYLGWTGPNVPAKRVVAASFFHAGLLPDVDQAAGDELLDGVKRTWLPTRHGLEPLGELEATISARSAAA